MFLGDIGLVRQCRAPHTSTVFDPGRPWIKPAWIRRDAEGFTLLR